MGSTIILRSRNDGAGNSQSEFDLVTQETIVRKQAAVLDEDFLGAGHLASFPTSATSGYPWVAKIVGAAPPTVGIVANLAGGIAACTLTSASQKQDAVLYAADQLNWDMTKTAIFEARIKLSVLPSAAEVEMVWGLQSAWIDGPDNASFYAQFQCQASGAINMRTKDGVNTVSKATGTTVLTTDWHNYRIDATDPTNVLFLIDGALVSANNMAFAATGANAILQPYMSCYKASNAGVGTMQIDMVQVAMNRS